MTWVSEPLVCVIRNQEYLMIICCSELSTARKLLGPDAIIGVTVSTGDEALAACEGGADYLGIGTVHATAT
jgi:hypothetical protein